VFVYAEEALVKQINELRMSRQMAEQQREELMQRAQQLRNKSQENVVSGKPNRRKEEEILFCQTNKDNTLYDIYDTS